MMHEIEILEARRIAELAAIARDARDQALAPLREAELGEPQPARGQHHPSGALSFGALPEEAPARQALRQAIEELPDDMRRKIWVAMRIGCGDYARGDWDEALTAAGNLFDAIIVSDLTEDVDLHDKLMKGLYEIGGGELSTPAA
jgi:hypothetical protein